jgi:hypothetical protein
MPPPNGISQAIRGGITTGVPLGQAWWSGRAVRAIRNNTGKIGKSDILVVCRLPGDTPPSDWFLDYYRRLGANHFLILGAGAAAQLRPWAERFADVSLFAVRGKARGSLVPHYNHILQRYGSAHLCVLVEPEEFLVYPFMDTRSLRVLGQFLLDDRRVSMSAIVIDTYGREQTATPPAPLEDGPLAAFPYFDRDGYIQTRGWGQSTRITGGPLMRLDRSNPDAAPSLNRIAVIWWKRFYSFHDLHTARPWRLNRAHKPGELSTTACLLRVGRASPAAYEAGISERFESWHQLVELGLMSPGNWY